MTVLVTPHEPSPRWPGRFWHRHTWNTTPAWRCSPQLRSHRWDDRDTSYLYSHTGSQRPHASKKCKKKKIFSHQNMAFHVAPKNQSIDHRSRIKQEFRNTVLESVRSGSKLGSVTSLCDLEQLNHSVSLSSPWKSGLLNCTLQNVQACQRDLISILSQTIFYTVHRISQQDHSVGFPQHPITAFIYQTFI